MLPRLPPIFKMFLKLRQTEEVLQLEEGVVTEKQTAVTIQSVQQAAAFADRNVQYQFCTADRTPSVMGVVLRRRWWEGSFFLPISLLTQSEMGQPKQCRCSLTQHLNRSEVTSM
ncbi:upstream stimulatory factor 2 [Oncorhynchus keta]|uniref:upstream stimulatory factor 2 n=1 Tax=Oncorhynchus keta TaxID=8018 RepID=UPI0015F94EC5|nr:upstream stimulatory factor 2 [Oncorhynchus keta]